MENHEGNTQEWFSTEWETETGFEVALFTHNLTVKGQYNAGAKSDGTNSEELD